MTDSKLIEAVARDLCTLDGLRWENLVGRIDHPLLAEYRKHATVAIAAINASGTHWVAPVEATEEMAEFGGGIPGMDLPASMHNPPIGASAAERAFIVMRTAYLAKTEETA